REFHRHRAAGRSDDGLLPDRLAPLPRPARPRVRGARGGAVAFAAGRGIRPAKLDRRRLTMKPLLTVAAALSMLAASQAGAQSTLEAVTKKGFVQCGVNVGLAGFSQPDSQGVWKGIDVDLCRAVAAAVFGDATKVRYTPLTAQQRFTALQSGEIDILSRNTTWTITRDTSLGLNFVGVNYYDGQGFMVPKKLKVRRAKQLNGATVCVQPGTTTELNLADYFRANKMSFKPVVIE